MLPAAQLQRKGRAVLRVKACKAPKRACRTGRERMTLKITSAQGSVVETRLCGFVLC